MKLLFTAFLCAMMAMPMCAQSNGYGNGNQSHGQFDGGRGDMRRSRAANAQQVDAVVELIKGTSFDQDRLKIASVCLQLRRMNAADIGKIARCFSFNDGTKNFLRMAIEYCADVKNYYSLRTILPFISDQEDFVKYVDSYIKEHPEEQGGPGEQRR